MRIHFLLLALVAVVVLSQRNVDARLHDPALRRMTEHRLLDELLQRRMEALEEMEGEQGSLQDRFVESRRLMVRECSSHADCGGLMVSTCYYNRDVGYLCRGGEEEQKVIQERKQREERKKREERMGGAGWRRL